MGGFIAGPVIRFSIDESSLSAQIQAALSRVNAQVQTQNRQINQNISSQVVNPLLQQAAQLRALYATGQLAGKDLVAQQKNLIGLLDTQIKQLATQDALTKNQLATLKALTLERERQQNAVNRGLGVGVTAGTQSALSFASAPIVANISRLGAGLIGISGGSGLEVGAFGAAAGGIAAIAENGGIAIGVLGGLATAMTAAGIAATSLAVSGGALAERLSNISQRTGISVQDLQVLESVAKVSELSLEDLVTGFRKFSQALTGGGGGEAGGFADAGKKSAQVLQVLGVTSKDSFTALEQVADAFQKLPDGPTKSATAIELFGRSGLQLIPILNQGKNGIEEFRSIADTFAPTITNDVLKAQNDWQKATVELGLAFDQLKVRATPILKFLTDFTTGIAEFINIAQKNPGGTLKEIFSAFLSGSGVGGVATNLALLSVQNDKTAASFGNLEKGFSAAEAGASKMKRQLDALLAGDEARKQFAEFVKQINENAKQFEQTQIARGFAAETLIGGILARPLPGASEGELLIAQTQEEIKKVQEAVLGLPGIAEDAQRAIDRLNSDLLAKLSQMEQDAAEKASEAVNKILEEDAAKRTAILNIIKKAQDQAAIDAADANKNAVQKILAEAQKQYDEESAQLKAQGANYQDYANLRVAIEQDAQAKIAKARQDEINQTNKDIQNQTGQLFDALVSGSGSFTQALKRSLTSIALTPVKLAVEAVAGAIFTPIVQASKDALKNVGDILKGQGGILGAIGKNLSPDSAIGSNTQSVQLNTTSTDRNTDALNNLTGVITGQKSGAAGNAGSVSGAGSVLFGTILGGAVAGSGGLIFNNQASGSAAGLFGALAPAAALLSIFGGASNRNVGQAIGGGISLIGSRLGSIGTQTGNSSLSQLGGALAGAGLVVSGISKGGLGGAATAGLGGAELGFTFGGPVGAAIGAVAGFVAGLFGGLFHHGPTQAQIQAAIRRQTVSPNSPASVEFDRAAQSTFAQTLNTTFSEGPGGTFSNAFLNGPRQAPVIVNYAPTIQAMDSTGVSAVLARHGGMIAAEVGRRANATQTGLASSIRRTVSPA